jgi:hypothetical protein
MISALKIVAYVPTIKTFLGKNFENWILSPNMNFNLMVEFLKIVGVTSY